MKLKTTFLFLISICAIVGCEAQNKTSMEDNNPLLCDPDSGLCELPSRKGEISASEKQVNDKATIVYFTDPICSSCWGIEPQLRKLKLAYGDQIHIEYRMGGLLSDWSYNSGGISKPSDVAHHWDEVSGYYDMPIDGDIWLEDPLHSSYPPSIAFKAAQMQDEEKAVEFLREIREMVFLQKRNITKWEYLKTAAMIVGLDAQKMKSDMDGRAKELFEQDLSLAKLSGVRGFPTMFFVAGNGSREIVYGSKPYASYHAALAKQFPDLRTNEYIKDAESLFKHYPTLTAKEFATLSNTERNVAEVHLNELVAAGTLEKSTTKNGSIWRLKQ